LSWATRDHAQLITLASNQSKPLRLVGRCTNGGGVIFRRLSEKMGTDSCSNKLAPFQQESPRAQSPARGPEGALMP